MESAPKSHRTPLDEDFNSHAQALLEEWHVPGMSIAVIDGDHTFSKGYGLASFPGQPVTPATLFFTASTTKSFTSAAISLLIDDDARSVESSNSLQHEPLTWETRISSLIPDDFILSDAHITANATIEDALCHRTGMPNHENSFPSKNTNVRGMARNLRNLPMTGGFREEFIYNDYMYSTISHLIETRTERDLGDFMKERIWGPLCMDDTFWTLQDALAAEAKGNSTLARGYAWDSANSKLVSEDLPDFPGVSGAGAIISSVLDYTKYLRCMLTCSPPLSPAGHVTLTHPRIKFSRPGNIPFASPNFYALGWALDVYRGEKIVWHTGGWTGFGALMCFLPGRQWGCVMFGNTSRTSNYVQIVLWYELLDRLLETPASERLDWNKRFRELVRKRREDNAKAKERLYPDITEENMQTTLPLELYVGSYVHPGYGKIDFVVDGAGLVADRRNMEIVMDVRLEHVSGEFWLARLEVKNRDSRDVEVVRAEFTIAADGKVKSFGIELEPRMGKEKIWFVRVVVDSG